MSENIKKAKQAVAELNKRLQMYKKASTRQMKREFAKNNVDAKPPRDFKGSSYLYMRSYEGDTGIRPFSGITFWLSPDITVAPITNLAAFTRELNAGETYEINANIKNAGDLHVPSAKAEFFLVNPTIGFDVRLADKLGMTSTWISPFSSENTRIRYVVPPSAAGHKCLFVRTFSFSPLDVPVDDYGLDPRIDRHIGQLNLNIVGQGSRYSFNMVHLPQSLDLITFKLLSAQEMMQTGHPMVREMKLVSSRKQLELMGKIRLMPTKQGAFELRKRLNTYTFSSQVNKGYKLETQKGVFAQLEKALVLKARIGRNEETKKVEANYRKMMKSAMSTPFDIEIPNLGLRPGEVAGMDIIGSNRINRRTKGGIRLLITS